MFAAFSAFEVLDVAWNAGDDDSPHVIHVFVEHIRRPRGRECHGGDEGRTGPSAFDPAAWAPVGVRAPGRGRGLC